MKEIIEQGRDFKIIPQNFQSATIFEVKSVAEDRFEVELSLINDTELNDYYNQEEVEIFGSSEDGLIYFVTEIIGKNDRILTIKLPDSHKSIQRREYSRVDFNGTVQFSENQNIYIKPKDISAGGLRLLVDTMLEVGKEYTVLITLSNNMSLEATMQPIRISESKETKENGAPLFMVSGRFKNIKSVDRIALVQYSFKALMEAENKDNDRKGSI